MQYEAKRQSWKLSTRTRILKGQRLIHGKLGEPHSRFSNFTLFLSHVSFFPSSRGYGEDETERKTNQWRLISNERGARKTAGRVTVTGDFPLEENARPLYSYRESHQATTIATKKWNHSSRPGLRIPGHSLDRRLGGSQRYEGLSLSRDYVSTKRRHVFVAAERCLPCLSPATNDFSRWTIQAFGP